MRQVQAIFVVTFRQLLSRKLIWLLAGLAALPALVVYVGTRSMTDARAFEFFHEAPMAAMLLVVIPVITLMLASAALGEEKRQSTLPFLALRPIPRWAIVASKLAAAWAASLLLTASAVVLAAAALGVRAGDWEPLVPYLILALINTLVYSAIFLLLGYFTGRAVLYGLGYVFIWESGISLGVSALASFSVSRIGLSAYAGLVPDSVTLLEEPLGNVAVGAGGATIKAIVIGLLAVLVTTQFLTRRDLA